MLQNILYLCSRNDAERIGEFEKSNKDIYFIKERNL